MTETLEDRAGRAGREDLTGRHDLESPAGQAAPAVRLSGVSKAFGSGANALLALDDVSLDVAPGEFVCLLGASGCGKSTLLNLVADLDRPSAGTVTTGGRVALMFQEPALFPWMTVTGNIELALRQRGVPRRERRSRAARLLGSVHLDGFAGRRPHQLSGGMRQRVALARALALTEGATENEHEGGAGGGGSGNGGGSGTVLLMDEPFGALDAMTRDLLHDELERIWRTRGLTVLFVTHNVREAVRLGDRVVLLSSRPGRVLHEFPVELERQRRIDSPEVATLAATITDRLKEEVGRHGS